MNNSKFSLKNYLFKFTQNGYRLIIELLRIQKVSSSRNDRKINFAVTLFLVLWISIFLSSCIIEIGNPGSDDESETPSMVAEAPKYSVRGNAMVGLARGSVISAYRVSANGNQGELLDSTVTGDRGDFILNIPEDYIGPVLFELTQGEYKDLATGGMKPFSENQGLRLFVPSIEKDQKIAITALTEIASSCITEQVQQGGEINSLILDINKMVSNDFGIQNISLLLIDRYNVQNDYNIENSRYAYIHAGFSEFSYLKGADGAMQSIQAFSEDYTDCVFDGKKGENEVFLAETNIPLPEDSSDKLIWDAVDSFIQSGKKIE